MAFILTNDSDEPLTLKDFVQENAHLVDEFKNLYYCHEEITLKAVLDSVDDWGDEEDQNFLLINRSIWYSETNKELLSARYTTTSCVMAAGLRDSRGDSARRYVNPSRASSIPCELIPDRIS
jgi:hypothetical protein